MLKKTLAAALIVTSLSAMTGATVATAGGSYVIDKRQDKQDQAIRTGRKDGGLTFLEAYKLRREQKRIATLERRYKSDGGLQRGERRQLTTAQNHAAEHIYESRTNGRVRGWWWRNFVR